MSTSSLGNGLGTICRDRLENTTDSVILPTIIAIDGLIASGKSTFLHYLSKKHPDWGIVFEPIKLYQSFKSYNPLKELSQSGFATQYYISQVIKSYYQECENKLYNYNVIITERNIHSPEIFSEVLYQNKIINSYEYDIFKHHCNNELKLNTSTIAKFDGVYILDVSPELCMKRVKQRARSEEIGFVTLEYLELLKQSYEKFYNSRDTHLYYHHYHSGDMATACKVLENFVSFICNSKSGHSHI